MQYWYNVATGRVESDDERAPGADVMGPYGSADEAAQALETARRKTDQWDAEDKAWDERGATPGWDDTELED